jgi:D-beta-D-heptose 7-phosphate kinase/D-beta-D-heptose 1-phosphate adenosyltransferase
VTTVVVLGDALLDRDVIGRVERVCPDAPVPVVDVERVVERPGGAALAALVLADAAPDVDVVLVAAIGTDEAGRRLRGLLHGRVGVHDVLRRDTTPAKTRVRVGGQSMLRVDDAGHLLGAQESTSGPVDGRDEAVDIAALEALLRRADAVLVADYGGVVARHPVVRSALAERARHAPLVWDPHPRGQEPVAGAAVVTPNRSEAMGFLGVPALGDPAGSGELDPLCEIAEQLRRRWSARAVSVTDGERGAVTAVEDAAAVRASGPLVPGPVDACGAGDRFAAAVTLAMAGGASPQAAVAASVGEVSAWLAAGGVSAVLADVDPARHPASALTGSAAALAADPASAVDPASAEAVVAAVRARGGTVVATGGCFDVLHAGHLSSLQAARALGNCLIVLLNSDESVRRLKGPGRPVHAAADRARLLEALACVDAVAVFEDDNPVDTLCRLRPDVWVKAGDYAVADLPEAATVEEHGGRVVLVPFVDGHSTTSILAGLGV